MESYYGAPSSQLPLLFWRSAEPVARVSPAVWPALPLGCYYEAALTTALYPANAYAGVGVPCFYGTVARKSNPTCHTEQQLTMHADYVEENLTLGDCTNVRNGSQKQPHKPRKMANLTHANVSPLWSEQSTMENKSIAYHSFDSVRMDGKDVNGVQSAGLKRLNCPQGPENGTKKQGQDCTAYNDEHEDNLGLNDHRAGFHSVMEEDMSILAWVPRDGQKLYSGAVANNVKTMTASSELMELDKSASNRCADDKGTSPMPGTFSADAMVGTELAQCVSAFTQTDDPKPTDKNVNTEVRMSDLDYVAAEFLKLKKAQEEVTEKMKSSACKVGSGCDCMERARQAELSLLTLQYSMCRQHCWTLYCTAAAGHQVNPSSGDMNQYWPKDPPANILGVLEKLESDYNELRDKIQEGISLKELMPLSVDCGTLTSATYIPAQVIANLRGSLLSQCSPELQKKSTSSDKAGCPDEKSTNDCQGKAQQVTLETCKARRAVTLVPRGRGAFHDAQKLVENQTTAACKELTVGEVWYDAEEDPEPAAAAGVGQNYKCTAKDRAYGSASEETKSCVLSNLTCDATEVVTRPSWLQQQEQAGGLCPAHTKATCVHHNQLQHPDG